MSGRGRGQAGKPDYAILVTVLVLVVIGLIFVYSASFAIALDAYGDVNYFLYRQAIWAVAGLALMLLLMRIDYRNLRLWSPIIMLGSIVALLLVLVLGHETYGAQSRVELAGLPIQPSEFAKFALIIYVAAWLTSRGRDIQSFALGTLPFVFLVGVVSALVLIEPDTGTAAIIVLTTVTLFFLAGASLTHLATLAGIGSVTAVMLIVGSYRAERFFAFFDPGKDPDGVGFQIIQMLIALGSGGIDGLGLGVSRQKFFYIPGAHTDGVFAIIGEETGFFGAVLVIGLFAYLVYRGFRVMLNARDDFGAYLAAGVICWISYQALINIGGVTRSIPLTGVPLPFVSYGGASLLTVLGGIGILLSVSRFSKEDATSRVSGHALPPAMRRPARPRPRTDLA